MQTSPSCRCRGAFVTIRGLRVDRATCDRTIDALHRALERDRVDRSFRSRAAFQGLIQVKE